NCPDPAGTAILRGRGGRSDVQWAGGRSRPRRHRPVKDKGHMPLVVQKFGGSSVATAERIMAAARRAIRARQGGSQVIVVVSARGDTTDELIALAKEISPRPPAREMDML